MGELHDTQSFHENEVLGAEICTACFASSFFMLAMRSHSALPENQENCSTKVFLRAENGVIKSLSSQGQQLFLAIFKNIKTCLHPPAPQALCDWIMIPQNGARDLKAPLLLLGTPGIPRVEASSG